MIRWVRPAGALAITLLITLLITVLGAGNASAHDSLIGVDPADGATIATGPATITLTFSDLVQNLQPLVTVVGPDGGHWEGSPVAASDNTVTAPVNPLGPAGVYTVAFRVISADGHPVEGSTTFTLSAAGTGTANPAATAGTVASNDIPGWVWILASALVLVAVVIGGVVTTRRRRED